MHIPVRVGIESKSVPAPVPRANRPADGLMGYAGIAVELVLSPWHENVLSAPQVRRGLVADSVLMAQ